MPFAVKVVWDDGEEEYLHPGTNPTGVAFFPTRKKAQDMADFMRQGMEGCQSINVVKYPKGEKNAV
jgi:hypothetical protein